MRITYSLHLTLHTFRHLSSSICFSQVSPRCRWTWRRRLCHTKITGQCRWKRHRCRCCRSPLRRPCGESARCQCTWQVLRANPRQVNKQGLLHLWHLQCLMRQPVWHRQPEVRDVNKSSAALKRSLLVHVHTMFTLPVLSTLRGTIIIGIHACCHTLTAQDGLSK